MKLSKIPVPERTWLVEIITNEHEEDKHMICFLDKEGQLVENPVHVEDATASEVVSKIGHMCIVQFTDKQMWEVNCACMYNQIFEPDLIPYNAEYAWQMDAELVAILRHFCKINQVYKYKETDEYIDEVHILDDFIYSQKTPIEQKSKEVYSRGIKSRHKFLDCIKNFCL